MPDKKGRLFGVINVVDLFVIIIILVGVVFGGYTYLKHAKPQGSAASTGLTDVYVTVDLKQQPEGAFLALRQGDRCVAKNAFVDGVIDSSHYEDSTYIASDSSGKIVLSKNSMYKDGWVVIKSQADPTAAIIKIAGQECRVGIPFYCKTNHVEMYGKVSKIEWRSN